MPPLRERHVYWVLLAAATDRTHGKARLPAVTHVGGPSGQLRNPPKRVLSAGKDQSIVLLSSRRMTALQATPTGGAHERMRFGWQRLGYEPVAHAMRVGYLAERDDAARTHQSARAASWVMTGGSWPLQAQRCNRLPFRLARSAALDARRLPERKRTRRTYADPPTRRANTRRRYPHARALWRGIRCGMPLASASGYVQPTRM